MAEELSRVPDIRFHLPEGAFYFFVDVSAHGPSLPLCMRILERRNVVTIAGVAFGERGEGFLRISYAASDEDIRTGIRAIAEELGERR
jgi:aspartate/methionine/tyrosine aminotransferase